MLNNWLVLPSKNIQTCLEKSKFSSLERATLRSFDGLRTWSRRFQPDFCSQDICPRFPGPFPHYKKHRYWENQTRQPFGKPVWGAWIITDGLAHVDWYWFLLLQHPCDCTVGMLVICLKPPNSAWLFKPHATVQKNRRESPKFAQTMSSWLKINENHIWIFE